MLLNRFLVSISGDSSWAGRQTVQESTAPLRRHNIYTDNSSIEFVARSESTSSQLMCSLERGPNRASTRSLLAIVLNKKPV